MTYQREIRLGLVLYGGVSLAVYENGVAQELYRAVCGKGVYELISKLLDAEIVIDIISGTSAGGVNGIMLAYALANKCDFTPSADLWRDQGDIQALMRDENDANGSSILNSDYYQKKLTDCFQRGLAPSPNAPHIGELDLFITSTDANGRLSTVFDDLGHAIDIKDHRAIFQLQYRGERKNDLKDAQPSDLATLSRMTSCFPVAFQPVEITAADKNFFKWGKLRGPAVYLDGGILNNKPFTSTIDAIEGRMATRAVERFLIYVDPNPERFAPPTPNPPTPSMVQAAFSSLVSIPAYQSIAGDLQAIEAHNERAERLKQIVTSLPPAPHVEPEDVVEADVLAPPAPESDPGAYSIARLMQLRDTVIECILDDDRGRGYFRPVDTASSQAPQQDARRSGRILVESFDAWPYDWEATLKQYDVFFRMRRAKHLANTLMSEAEKQNVPEAAWNLANHYYKLYEIMKWAMTSWVTRWDHDWKSLSSKYPTLYTEPEAVRRAALAEIAVSVWGQAEDRLRLLLQTEIAVPANPDGAAREQFHQDLVAHMDGKGGFAASETSLLDAVDNAFKASLIALGNDADKVTVEIADALRSEFCRFLEVDRQLFLLQAGSGFESMDVIRVVRFSPDDAQRRLSEGEPSYKVRGSALAAFGGFFKKSWRANDIMMGRLDAACLIVESLLNQERLAALAPRIRANNIAVTASELQGYFPLLGANAAALEARINKYLDSLGTVTDPDRNQAEWNQMIDGIVSATHNEIFDEEWPTVVQCAIDQEYAWGQYRNNPHSPPAYDAKNLVWTQAMARPDEALVQVAAAANAAQKVTPFPPGANDPGTFLSQVPESILDELGALAAMRLGKGLLASIPAKNQSLRDKVEGSALYKYPFEWVAPIFYKWAKMRREQPDSIIIFNTAVPVFCLTWLVLDGLMIFLKAQLSTLSSILLCAAPAILLFVWAWKFRGNASLYRKRAKARRKRSKWFVAINTAIPVFCLTWLAMDGFMALHRPLLPRLTWIVLWSAPSILLLAWAWFFRR